MKIKLILVIILLSLLACQKIDKTNLNVKKFYPYTLKLNKNSSLWYDRNHDFLYEVSQNGDGLNINFQFYELKKDTITVNTKKIELPPFYKDIFTQKNDFIILHTEPRTLGKNLKSTDILTKYDENSRILLKKDMDISKYPNGNCFIVGNNERLFYISDWFAAANSKRAAESKLIISEIDTSFNILNQKLFKNKNRDFDYNPAKCIFIENIGIVIVSDMSYFEIKGLPFKIEMFDLDLNKKWSENFEANSIVSLGYSKTEKKISLVIEKEGTKVNFWDYEGKKQEKQYHFNSDLISLTSSDDNIFLLTKNQEKNDITKIDFSGKVIDKINLPKNIEINKKKEINLAYQENQLFLISIDNDKKLLEIDKITME
ncbi:hypothetical protein V6246_05265 [Algibacter sp. TI.3.09]|uniref:hypothetical protein n=1 Tax=Algibacter sp. TI.3.09 TaxID=3121298 RepID=UPI00311D72AF